MAKDKKDKEKNDGTSPRGIKKRGLSKPTKVALGAAAVALGGAALLLRDGETPDAGAQFRKGDTPQGSTDLGLGPVGTTSPGTESLPGVPIVKPADVEALVPTKDVTLLKILVKALAHHRLEVVKEGDGSKILMAIPQVSTGKTDKLSNLHQRDPVNELALNATDAQVTEVVEAMRDYYRKQGSVSIGRIKNVPYKNAEDMAYIPEAAQDDRAHAVPIARIGKNNELMLQIDLRSTKSPEYGWFKMLTTTHAELVAATEAELKQYGELGTFLKETLIKADTKEFNYDAERALLSVFSLTPEDREQFAAAVAENDHARAKEILLLRSAKPPITQDLFDAVANYVIQAKDKGLSASDIQISLERAPEFCKNYAAYDDLQKEIASRTPVDESKVNTALLSPYDKETLAMKKRLEEMREEDSYSFMEDRALPDNQDGLLHRVLNEEQYKALAALPPYLARFLDNSLIETDTPVSYGDFQQAYKKFLLSSNGEEVEIPAPEILDAHTFEMFKKYAPSLLGTADAPGWAASTDRNANIVSMCALVDHLAELLQHESVNSATSIFSISTGENGNPSLRLKIPASDTTAANKILSAWTDIAQAAGASLQLPTIGSLRDALESRHEANTYGSGESRLEDLIKAAGAVKILSPEEIDIFKAYSDPNGYKGIIFEPATQEGVVKLPDIEVYNTAARKFASAAKQNTGAESVRGR